MILADDRKDAFLLTTLKVVYVLTTPMPELVEDATVEAIRIRAKWENDDYICRGHILNRMSYSLFDVYTNVNRLRSCGIHSNPSTWQRILLDFKHTLKHGKDDLSLVQLGSHFCIEESLRAQKSDKGKGKEVGGPSINMTEERKNKHNKQNKGKKWSNENNSGSSSNKKPKLECWKCGKTGHFKRDCRSGKKNNANVGGLRKGSKDQSKDQGKNLVLVWNRFIKYFVSLISEAFYVQVDAIAWWIDSGATTHVCKDRCWFKTYEPVEDGSILYMGGEHFAPVHGKGSVALEFSSRKTITLLDMSYVPKLRKNLVSGPVLNKCGHKQVYESDKYILSKSGVFVGFGYYNNGMFMLNLNKVPDDSDSVYMSSSTVVNSSLWHARLEHVHYKRMLEMSKDDLIPGIIHEIRAPYTPQQNGVAERKNRALKKMVNFVLSYSGLSEGFWGEAMAVVRLPDQKRKTLGEKGIDCIFVGYAEHSKAYRFYVIKPNESVYINSIIESRDTIFDENRFSLIPRPNDIIPNSNESQRDDHSDDVPSETLEPRKVLRRILEPKMKLYNLKMLHPGKKQLMMRLVLLWKIIHRTDQNQVDKTKKFLSSKFSMKDMGEADVILGIKIKRENKGIVITQSHYIEKILKKSNREDCSPVSTPMYPVEKLKPNTGKPVDQPEYSRVIGCLMYAMTSTRPDIAYAVGRLSSFTSNPSRQHWHAITRVFKYLKGTMNYGLSYVGYPSVLEAYSDASWINHVKDSSSTSRWVFMLGGGAMSWASKKQTCITSSTMESEFVALAAVGKEAEWLRNLIHEIPIWPKPIAPISIHCDSAATLAKAYSQIYNGKSRHLGVRHSMIRELIMNGVISIEFVRSQHNLADHLTKALARDLVIKSVIGMGLKSI
ncbi:zinc finger, CCHC-type containing protein [Tanacetum coccineum]